MYVKPHYLDEIVKETQNFHKTNSDVFRELHLLFILGFLHILVPGGTSQSQEPTLLIIASRT